MLDILVQSRRNQQEANLQAKTVATWGTLSYCSRMALRRRLAASPASQSLSEPSMAPKHEDDRTDDLKGNHQQ
ncbi:MAG TPA: hypothetical protein VGW38_24715 [Chloroflexota bacterium]|nr:hypothetical protein [Chloroflexota bacterium]